MTDRYPKFGRFLASVSLSYGVANTKFRGVDREGGPPDPNIRVYWTLGSLNMYAKIQTSWLLFFLLQHLCQKNFLSRVSTTTITGVVGDKVNLDAILYVISFRYRLTPTSWKNPEVCRHQSLRELKKAL